MLQPRPGATRSMAQRLDGRTDTAQKGLTTPPRGQGMGVWGGSASGVAVSVTVMSDHVTGTSEDVLFHLSADPGEVMT